MSTTSSKAASVCATYHTYQTIPILPIWFGCVLTSLTALTIKKDDSILLVYPSGNRDEEVFDDPFKFKVDRSPNKHLAFGYGAHLCLGKHLAKMEMEILYKELFKRIEKIELNGEPSWVKASFVSGLKSLPIKYKIK